MKITKQHRFKMIAILICFFIGLTATSVFATNTVATDDTTNNETSTEVTFTDFSKATYSLTRENRNYYLEIKNVDLIFDENEEVQYLAFLTTGNEEVPIKYDEDGGLDTLSMQVGTYTFISSAKLDVTALAGKKLTYAGDIYLTIVEYHYGAFEVPKEERHKIVANKVKLTRPSQLKLTERIHAYFLQDLTSIFNYELYQEESEMKYNIKIGRVTDMDLLRSIQNGEANCLQNLMTYAKNTSPLYETTVNKGESESITNKFTIIDDAYYYGYISLDTENGTYYPIEDIMLYQGSVSDHSISLSNYLDADFVWKLEGKTPQTNNNITINQTTNTTNTTSNQPTNITGNLDNTKAPGTIPQTGSIPFTTICILAVILGIGGVAYYHNRKYQGL